MMGYWLLISQHKANPPIFRGITTETILPNQISPKRVIPFMIFPVVQPQYMFMGQMEILIMVVIFQTYLLKLK